MSHPVPLLSRLSDLRPGMLDEVEAFFAHYNQLAGRDFTVIRRGDAEAALSLVRQGVQVLRAA